MLTPGLLFNAVLFVLGIVWCRHVVVRLPDDLAEFRDPSTNGTDRRVIAFFWLITAFVVWALLDFAWAFLG